MPTNYTNRVLTILLTLWIALSAIYPRVPGSLFWFFNPTGEISFRDNLKPGIDMVGGTSLTYEIKPPEGSILDPKLAENVATALKLRVDPNGVRNLIWRPEGATRIQIQMPTSRQNTVAVAAQKDYLEARKQLQATNIRLGSVINDLETRKGAERDAKLAEYVGGSAKRGEILPKLATAYDALATARQNRDAAASAEAFDKLDPLQKELEATNLDVSALESALDAPPEVRTEQINKFKTEAAGFPARLTAIDNFTKAYDTFRPLRGKVDDVDTLKRQLAGSGVLSFHIVVKQSDPIYAEMAQRLRENGPRPQPGDVAQWVRVNRPGERGALEVPYQGRSYMLVYVDQARSLINKPGRPTWGLSSASKQRDEFGKNAVGFNFDSPGALLFGDLTGRFAASTGEQHQLAVVLNEEIYTAPNLNERINGSGIISSPGGFSGRDQQDLINTLNAGALPAQLRDEPISEITVGPQLGADNLRAGLYSSLAGLVICAIFLIGYYYRSGVVAFIAVVINLVLILGAMAAINATFTLPGVAGIVLSVAMAVDANVLIFERLREEQARGLSLKMALRNAYDRAFSAIFDGQLTTAITSAFLFWFGSEEVRGFGLTLLIGIVTSLFTALFVTKTIFGIMVTRFGVTDLSSLPRTFPKWNEMLTPKIDWVGKAWICGILSWGFIVFGLVLFSIKFMGGEAMDIEFSGGTTVRIALKEDVKLNREQVQEIVDLKSREKGNAFASPRVIAVGADGRQFEISTPTISTKDVQEAVLESLGPKLDITQPSTFRSSSETIQNVLDTVVLPIENAQTRIDGASSEQIAAHVGGVAIVLQNIEPAISETDIRLRLDQRLAQEADATRPAAYDVEAAPDGHSAVIFFVNNSYRYDPANANAMQQWRGSLAGPGWQIVQDAISNPPQLKSVTSFGPQVASEAATNTIVALTLSILGIMAYIWVRFGNFKYGTATVVACIHDGLFVLAAVGCSLYLGRIPFFENVLLIDPFRIDLTMVAAILTVIGYSMNDTVVVFDRIRENRGKFGVLSRQVINDSVNQTLSRTLLTGGTSLGILSVMYFIGGDGIHGFTFAMLLGIIVGTYSSMVIAAPLLLVGKPDESPAPVPAKAKPQIAG